MRDRELETPRHHTFDPALIEGLAAPWPRWPVDAAPRPFDREASIALALSVRFEFWEHAQQLEDALPERDGAVTREEAAFWFSLLSHRDYTTKSVSTPEWVRERSSRLGADPTEEEVLSLLRTAGTFGVPQFMARYMMRALRALVRWTRAFETFLGMTNARSAGGRIEFMGYCPEDQREEALAIARPYVDDIMAASGRVDPSLFALHAGLPTPEVVALALEEAPGQSSYMDRRCFELCLHADAARVDAFIRAREFVWEPRHVLLYVARRGLGDLDAFLDQALTSHRSYPERPLPETLAMFEHVKAPEVVARLQPHMERGGEVAEIAQRVIDEAVAEHAARGLLECCKRAGKKRTWAIGQLRRLLERDGGRAAIEAALETRRGKMVAFVRAEVLDHEDDVARVSLEDAPKWARELVTLAKELEEPFWLDVDGLPPLLYGEAEVALPGECVQALVRLDAGTSGHAEAAAAALARLTEASRTEASNALMRQWFLAERLSKSGGNGDGLEYARSLEWIARHPSPVGVAMLEEYIRASKPPNRSSDPRRMIDRATALLTEMESPEALAATIRVSLKGRREGTRAKASAALSRRQDALGVTREELRDLAVPAFGLNARGERELDYGPRTIRMKVEAGELLFEDLEGGKTYVNPPRCLKSDDVDAVVAARAVFDVTVKPIRAELKLQRRRLERAMVKRRSWGAEWWMDEIVVHPLLGPLARGLVWEVWRGGGPVTRARPTDDGGLIDVELDDVRLEGGDQIKLAHPLTWVEGVEGWTEHMLSFERTQPFDQLGRRSFGRASARAVLEAAGQQEALFDPKVLERLDREGAITYEPAKSWAPAAIRCWTTSNDVISMEMAPSRDQAHPEAVRLAGIKRSFRELDLDTIEEVTLSECARALTLAALRGLPPGS